ncbi:MAG: hypothetical protein ACJAVV_003044 [Alphaproteobacteria bacterium]|jgi:hypothetical protein
MKITDYINDAFISPETLSNKYNTNCPYPHIVMDNFINEAILEEFPDLSKIDSKIEYNETRQTKFKSDGVADISPKAIKLISFLNNDLFLNYLTTLTGIKKPLLSDGYLFGGGYHEIKNGGVLKVHADFNKHLIIDADKRLNILLYLNKDWQKEWGGSLELYDKDNLDNPVEFVTPEFNRCVIFTTTSFTYHGHPEPITCPLDRSRKSIALYYYSIGRPESETAGQHGTIFVETKGEKFTTYKIWKALAYVLTPPLDWRTLKKAIQK